VMHEMVFGVKPRWSRAADAAVMLPPELGRKLTKEERAVLDACRACTAKEPARRIGDAEGAGRLLTQRRAWWARRRENRRPLLVAAALVVAVAGGVAVAWVRTRHRPEEARSSLPSAESPLIVPTGEPADWTDISAVIAEVPDRIHCTRLLPDQRTIRFVWGAPPRAEDIDTITRKRVPSPLLPATYAEGCPDLSRDGKRLVYQGHTPDGRAFAFSSEDPHGRGAIPVVPTAEPSLSSEPTWLPDGDAFSYDIDSKHMGVFSMTAKHTTVLPEPTRRAFFTSFRSLSGGLIFVSGIHEVGGTDFVGTSWPSLREDARFRVDDFALDLRLHGQRVYYVNTGLGELVEFDKATLSARRLGRVGTQYIRHETFLADQLAFVSFRNSADLFVQGSDGRVSRVTKSGDVFAAEVCGPNVVVERERGARTFIERIDRNGNTLGEVVSGPGALSPGCSADGKTVFYIDSRAPWAVTSCDQQGCRRLTNRRALQLSVSPDGQRLALMSFDNRGISVWWMPAGGGEMHDVTDRSETLCPLRWASLRTLWVSRRRNGKITWTEVDADSRRETGNVKPGERDCTDGQPDPASPMTTDLRVVRERSSQLRLLDFKYLERP